MSPWRLSEFPAERLQRVYRYFLAEQSVDREDVIAVIVDINHFGNRGSPSAQTPTRNRSANRAADWVTLSPRTCLIGAR